MAIDCECDCMLLSVLLSSDTCVDIEDLKISILGIHELETMQMSVDIILFVNMPNNVCTLGRIGQNLNEVLLLLINFDDLRGGACFVLINTHHNSI